MAQQLPGAADAHQPVIEHRPGVFRSLVDGREVAVLRYRDVGAAWNLYSTFADPSVRGTTVATELVRRAMDEARDAGVTVIPTCPYIPVWLSKHPEYLDLVQQ